MKIHFIIRSIGLFYGISNTDSGENYTNGKHTYNFCFCFYIQRNGIFVQKFIECLIFYFLFYRIFLYCKEGD